MAYTWADVTVPTSSGANLNAFAEDTRHGILCGVGGNGLVYTTPDMETWTKQTAAESNTWCGLAFAPTLGANGRLVAVSQAGANRVMYSDDGGITWTSASASAANSWRSVVWADTLALFVAVSSSGAADGSTSCMTSPDGITWTTRATVNPRQAWVGLAWSHALGLLVAVSTSSSTAVMTSTNATAWTVRTTPASTTAAGVADGSSKLIWDAGSGLFLYGSTVGGSNYRETTSPDGVTWTNQTIPDSTSVPNGLLSVAGTGIVLFRDNTGTEKVNTSLNAVAWDELDTGISGRNPGVAGQMASLRKVCAWCDGFSTHMLVGSLPPFVVTSVSPSTGSVNGSQAVTIRGMGFSGATGVTFGGTAVTSFVIVNDTTITAIVPQHASGVVDVAVLGVAVGTALYTYVIPRPTLPPMPSRTPIFQGRSRG